MADKDPVDLDSFSDTLIASGDRLILRNVSKTNGTGGGAGGTLENLDPQALRQLLIEPNFLINGGGDFFQRQDPATLTSRSDDTYAGDRWYVLTQTAAIQTQQTTGDTNSTNAHRLKQNQASAQRMGYAQIVEAVNTKPLRGRAVRFQARVNISAGSQTVRIAILEWTGTADSVTSDVVNDWTSTTYTAGNFFNSTTLTVTATDSVAPSSGTWTDISVTGTISSSANNIIVLIWTSGTQAQNVTLDITEAGLYDGTSARSWLPRPYAQEDILCKRFCYQLTDGAFYVSRYSTAHFFMYPVYPVTMRGTPTVSNNLSAWVSGTSPGTTEVAGYDLVGDVGITITGSLTLSAAFTTANSARIDFAAGTSFSGSGANCQVRLGTGAKILFDAEL